MCKIIRNGGFPRVPGRVWDVLILVGLVALVLLARLGMAAPVEGYRIGPGDVLKITVYGHEDLTPPRGGAADGRMPFPLIGDVQASGLSPTELEARLRQLLGKDYLVDPQVTVAVQEYRSQKVFVLGEAEKAGSVPAHGPGHAARRPVAGRRPEQDGRPAGRGRPVPEVRGAGDAGDGGQHDAPREPQEAPGRRRLREPRARERGHDLLPEADELLRSRRGEEAWGIRAGEGDVGARGDHARGWVHRARRLHGGEDPPEEAGRQPGDDRHRPGGHGSPRPRASSCPRATPSWCRPGTASTCWAR